MAETEPREDRDQREEAEEPTGVDKAAHHLVRCLQQAKIAVDTVNATTGMELTDEAAVVFGQMLYGYREPDDTVERQKQALYQLAIGYAGSMVEKELKEAERAEDLREEMKVPPAYASFTDQSECKHPGLRIFHDYISIADIAGASQAVILQATIARECLAAFAVDGIVRCLKCTKLVSTEMVETGKLWEKEEAAEAEEPETE